MSVLSFDSVFTQCVYILGTTEPVGSAAHTDRFGARHLLVDYSPVLLRNIGEPGLADDLRDATNGMAGTAWVIAPPVGNSGEVRTFSAALSYMGHDQRVISDFERFVAGDKAYSN